MTGDRSDLTQDLVRRAQEGDREGFTLLYGHLAPALYTWIDLRLSPGMRSRLETEDLMHEVWWKALDAFATFDREKGTFRAWLFTIAKRVFISSLRRTGAVPARGWPQATASGPSAIPESVTDVSRQVARDQVLVDVVEALRELDETDRAIFVHCGLEGRSATRVAALLDLSRDAVLKRWQRLRERLRKDVPEGVRLIDDLA